MSRQIVILLLFAVSLLAISGCRRGCMKDTACVTNYDSKAKKEGDCTGCIDLDAHNFCPDADTDDGSCVFLRRFYAGDTAQGWYDVWVSDSVGTTNPALLRYEGRTGQPYVNAIPDCDFDKGMVDVTRADGEYYYEFESETGVLEFGWVVFRREGCRLFVLP